MIPNSTYCSNVFLIQLWPAPDFRRRMNEYWEYKGIHNDRAQVFILSIGVKRHFSNRTSSFRGFWGEIYYCLFTQRLALCRDLVEHFTLSCILLNHPRPSNRWATHLQLTDLNLGIRCSTDVRQLCALQWRWDPSPGRVGVQGLARWCRIIGPCYGYSDNTIFR